MSNLYYDTKRQARVSRNQLSRQGLLGSGIDLDTLGIIPLVVDHGLDIDIYVPVDTGTVEIREDGCAHIIYEKKNRSSDPESGRDIRKIMKEKINAVRDEILGSGIDFVVDSTVHTLQTRDADDLINLTGLLDAARLMPADTALNLRTAANRVLSVTAGDIVSLISTGIGFRSEVLAASWGIKDGIDATATEADAFIVYEAGIATGWPEKTPIPLA
ncbi:MAG: hypothetical protein V6Z89_14655 [Desulfobacter sp.]